MTPRIAADNRALELQRHGYRNAHVRTRGDEVWISCLAPAECGAFPQRVPLTGPVPRCGSSCSCGAEAKARAKQRNRA